MVVKKITWIGIALIAISMALCGAGYAYQIPYDNTNARYLYVFGKDGDPLMGKEAGNKMEIFIDVPAAEPGDVLISVFDPNTGGKNDWKKPNNEWDTTCEFATYGKELLDKKEFSADPQYDHRYYTFGPYSKDKGEKVGDHYRFRLVATGLSGDDQNLFKVRITPESAESFCEVLTFRLLPAKGDKMYFYPGVNAGTKSITVHNYDLDPNGGTSALSVSPISKHYPIQRSESGQWAETVVPVETSTAGRMVYIVTKETQRYANAGVKMTDDKGNAVPIYFRKGPAPISERPAPVPVVKKSELRCNQYTFDATASYDMDKQALTYLWNFGDGQTSTEPVVTHVFEKGGEYNVTLSVKDNSGLPCDSASTSQKVYVNTAPIAAFSCPDSVCSGDTVTFNGSATTDDTPEKLTYNWNFGDGAKGEGKTVTHTYAKGGQYNVTLMVNDNAGTICSTDSIQKVVRVNTAPVANAGKDVVMCLRSAGEAYNVAFDGTGSHDPDGDKLTYMWNFGDGATAEGAKVTHTYAKGGDYKATLTVNDGSGSACGTSTSMVNVNLNRAPVADAGDSKKACVGQSVSFDGSKSQVESVSGIKYQWAFGDGETGTGTTVSHVYQKGGTYSVVLTVDDGKGTPCSVSTDALQVNVNAAPVAALAGVKDICSGKQISFDASGSNDPEGNKLTYTWDFGDGTTETGGARMSHMYAKGGTYNVSVTVNDGKDSPCSSSTSSTRVKVNTPPVVSLVIGKACCAGMEQKFDASASSDADGDSLKYTWDFGDGTTAEGARVSHTYEKAGTYKVLLKVDDGSGTECSLGYASDVMKVNVSPVAVIKVK
jgi:PKD repeat protein